MPWARTCAIYAVKVRTAASDDAIHRLRRWLKIGRQLGLHCIDAHEQQGSAEMAIDFNDADAQREFTPFPPGNYRLQIKLKPSGGGWLRRSKSLYLQMLEMELTVIGGEHAGRKLWEFATVSFDESPDLEQAQAERYRTTLKFGREKVRAILESAREIESKDTSAAACAGRSISDYGELNGLAFFAWVDVKRGNNGYRDKNALGFVITPGSPEWANRPSAQQQRLPTASTDFNDDIPF
jgi:hypothetical protein